MSQQPSSQSAPRFGERTPMSNALCWRYQVSESFSVVSRFFIGIALPSLSSLAGLLGGLTLSVTFAYPFFTWVLIKKPANYSFSGYFHWGLGCLGVAFSLALSIGDIWSMVKLKFFSPKVKLMFKVSGFFLL
ncbi:hypothetical protein F2Q68_00035837 [Brassica cretica]|uniref:Amino acid transporter transmembrane domain-containing protein n=1 Tax=Brassica cretica TaxID=69181 RepID=A0A8S9H583_BRACR|nr:hypothetical protein F2Q68_00035837 [Brassica cretica]